MEHSSATDARELTYVVDGMSCGHCRVAVTEEVSKIVAAIDEAGYDAVQA
jgi:copper chaperone CopZ